MTIVKTIIYLFFFGMFMAALIDVLKYIGWWW